MRGEREGCPLAETPFFSYFFRAPEQRASDAQAPYAPF
jgi:hypothetical protein